MNSEQTQQLSYESPTVTDLGTLERLTAGTGDTFADGIEGSSPGAASTDPFS
jgi:hypothetical protein